MTKLDKLGKGIILMHDFQKHTAEALPTLLRRLKAGGYKVVLMKAKAGENGKLFGSITSKDVAEALKAQHRRDIDKKMFHMPEAIKALGESEVELRLYAGVTAKLKVKVEAES